MKQSQKVDKGSMAYNLSTPITRTQITLTSALYLTGSLAVMFSLIAIVGSTVARIVQPGVLDYGTFLMLTLKYLKKKIYHYKCLKL